MKPSAPSEVQELANQVGVFIQYWGFKSVHGRLWAHLFLSNEPLDAGALIKRLAISKALVSMSLKELMKYKVVRVAGRSPEGTVLYDANPDLTGVILNVLKMRERKLIDRVSAACQNLREVSAEEKTKHKLSDDRIEAMGDLIKTGRRTLESFLALTSTDMRPWRRFQSSDQNKNSHY
jgi:HTH-type transcriptional regulator, glycine betaine synthesis regulator